MVRLYDKFISEHATSNRSDEGGQDSMDGVRRKMSRSISLVVCGEAAAAPARNGVKSVSPRRACPGGSQQRAEV